MGRRPAPHLRPVVPVQHRSGPPGGYHIYETWQDDPNIPLASVKEYVQRLRQGEPLDRPTDEVLRERDRITGEYRELLATDDRATFDEMVALARLVFVYIEEHVLHIEHWMWATFWKQSKALAASLARMGTFDDPEDMFFLRRYEVAEAIYDTVAAWSVGSRPRGADYWRPIVARRREIHEVLDAHDPEPRSDRRPLRSASRSRSCCDGSRPTRSASGCPTTVTASGSCAASRRRRASWRDRHASSAT